MKGENDMFDRKNETGSQVIGCGVTSCRYNREGSECELHRIEVRPCRGCGANSGKPDDESCCGSYSQR